MTAYIKKNERDSNYKFHHYLCYILKKIGVKNYSKARPTIYIHLQIEPGIAFF